MESAARWSCIRPWLLWVLASLSIAAYAVPAHISEQLTSAPIDLVPGNKVVLRVNRVFQDWLILSLEFKRQPRGQKRPELGSYAVDRDSYVSLGSAADVQIRAQINGEPAGTFEAMPATSTNGLNIWRDMTYVAPDRKWHVGPPLARRPSLRTNRASLKAR